jgi:TonB family protein
MLSKRDGDELLRGLGGPETDWEETLVAEGLDAAAAAAIAGTTRPDVLQRLLELLHSARQEQGETGDLARQLREDLQAAEAEIRRLEADSKALADERQQQALETLSARSGRAEESVKHSQELSTLRHTLQQLTADLASKEAALGELRHEVRQRESTIAELSAQQATLEQQASQGGPATEEAEARVAELQAEVDSERAARAAALSALRAESEGRIEKLRREQTDALSAVRAQHAQELSDLRQQQEDAQSNQADAQYTALKKASEERWARMQQVQEETRRQFEAKLAAQQGQQDAIREEAQRERAAAIEELEAKLWAEKAQALVALKTEWEGRVERVRRENAQILELLNEEHRQEMVSLQQARTQAPTPGESLKRGDTASESGGVFAELEHLRGQIEKQYRAQLDELAARDTQAYDEAARQHQAAMEALAVRLESEKAEALAAQKAELEAELARVRREKPVGGTSANAALAEVQAEAEHEKAAFESELARAREERTALVAQLGRMRDEHAADLDQAQEMHQKQLEALQQAHAAQEPEAPPATDEMPTTSIRLDRLKSELIREHLAEIDDLKAAHADEMKRAVQEQIATRSQLEAGLREERQRAQTAEEHAAAGDAAWEVKLEKLRRANTQLVAQIDEQEQRLSAAARGASLPPPRNPRSTIPPMPVAPGSTTLSGIPRRDVAPRLPMAKMTIPPIAAAPPVVAAPPREHAAESPAPAPAPLVLPGPSPRRAGGRINAAGPPWPLIAAGGAVVLAIALAIGGFWIGRRRSPPEPAAEEPVSASVPAPATAAPATAAPAVQPAGTGFVDITSTPVGADVTIAGQPVGQTPVTSIEVRAGAHPVTVSKAGHERWVGSVVVEAGKKASLVADLKVLGAAAPATAAPVAAAGDAREYLENELDSPPKPIAGAPVGYPAEAPAQKAGSTVSVTVSFLIGADGGVSRIEVVESGGKALDVAALSAISKWRFSPGIKRGIPVKVRMTKKFSFRF